MVNKKFWVGISVLVFGIILSGCATNVASVKKPSLDKKPIPITGHDYTILGTVKLEKNWFGILGVSIEKAEIDAYFFQSGGITYVDLLEEAQKKYPDADAVIDLQIDYAGSFYAIFYGQRKNILTGLAIKYVKGPKN